MPWNLSGKDLRIVIGCFLCSFLAIFQSTSTLSIMDVLSTDLSEDFMYIMWVNASTYIAIIGFSLLNIEIADKYGKRTTMISGLAIFAVGCLIAPFSVNLYILILSKFVMGFGSSLILLSSLSIIKDKVDDRYISEALATNFALNCIAGALAPFFGLWITELIGWRAITLVLLPVCLISLLLVRGCENTAYYRDKNIRILPHLLYMVSMIMMLNALFMDGKYFWTFWVGLALFIMLCVHQKIAKEKFIDLSVFSDRIFLFSVIIGVLFYLTTYSMNDLITQYLQVVDGTTVILGMTVTLVLVATILNGLKPVLQLFLSPIIARVFKDSGAAKITFYSVILLCVAPLVYVVAMLFFEVNINAVICLFLVITIILGVTTSAFSPHNKSMIMGLVKREQRNVSSAIITVLDSFGKIAGVTMMSFLIYKKGGTTVETFTWSSMILINVVVVCCFVAVLLAYQRTRGKN